MEQEATTAQQPHGGGTMTDALSLFASRLSHHRYARTLHRLPAPASTTSHFNFSPHRSHMFGDEELRVLEAALSAGGDVAALLSTRSAARKLLRERVSEVFAAAAVERDGARLSVADFFARAFALAGDVEICLAMRYEALVLREAKYSDDLHLHVSHEEWSTFAQDSLDNGFYTIASKAFTNALVHIHPSHLDSTNSILKKNKVNDIRGLQNLAKSLSAQRSVQTQSAEYMKRKASSIGENCNLHSERPKLPGNLMFRLGIKTRNEQKLLRSRKRNSEEV